MTYAQPHSILVSARDALSGACLQVADGFARAQRTAYLKSLSDAELANHDIQREDIARHVAKDTYFT